MYSNVPNGDNMYLCCLFFFLYNKLQKGHTMVNSKKILVISGLALLVQFTHGNNLPEIVSGDQQPIN